MFSTTEFYPSVYEVELAGNAFVQEMKRYKESIMLPAGDPCSINVKTAIKCSAAQVWAKARMFQYEKMGEQTKNNQRKREKYMGELKVFENSEFGSVRAIEQNGEPWFVGKDVAERLGYKNTKDALANHVDEEDKRIIQRSEIATIENHLPKEAFPFDFVSADIPNRGLTIINESGLYSLVLSSKLPSAKAFKRWITSEVIPSIRKHDAYMTAEKLEEALLNPDTLIKLATDLKQEREQRLAAEAQIKADKPKVIFADAVAASQTSILVGDLAKLLKQNGIDMGQNKLFTWMRDNGYLMKQGSSKNLPTQRSMNMGLFEVKESSVSNPDGSIRITRTTKITGKGQVYFINKLKEQELQYLAGK